MAKHAPLLSPELKQYVTERYLADTPPRELVAEVVEKFGVTVKPAALRQWLTRSGLGKRKAELDRKTCALVSGAKVRGLARARAAEPAKHIEAWAEKMVSVTDKAFAMAETATKPRELASAVAAANTSIRIFRVLVGIDGPHNTPAASFNFHFASIVPTRVADRQPHSAPTIQVNVTPAPVQPENSDSE